MPFIKLVEPGFEGYNGKLSRVQFVNGASTESMPMRDAERLGNNMRIVDLETGKPISHTQYMSDMNNATLVDLKTEMPEFIKLDAVPDGPAKEPPRPRVKPPKGDVPPKAVFPPMDFTEDSLDAIVVKDGVKGLREFAKDYGVNGRSVSEIVKVLMTMKERAEKKQATDEPKTAGGVDE